MTVRAARLSLNLVKSSPGIARRKLAARVTRAMSKNIQRHDTDRSRQRDIAPNCDKRSQPTHELTDDRDEEENGAQEGKDDCLALPSIYLLGRLDDRFHVLHRICNHEDGE
ncbi:hypothetical protein IFM61606_05931 [Aspergillus udagawae]|uniref:Uncharacterized protein n=1 Tax=Aspergillus udagawae TaxID=91492 RepID=A0ABQ1B5F4_9EURO|nr:hypothetical protein IFM53868_07412 [Aspergillus udagawae]GFG16064.1 hypothetical protein IFM5058_07770 [Aspergillus udagawae]GFG25968.1 hypothetical protein IFM61606_05931 [Aspergillus udagawae]